MGFILLILSWVFTPIFEVINFATVIWVKRNFLKTLNAYYYSSFIDRDIFANHNYRTGLNFWFSKSGYEFGNRQETISSVLGKKHIEKSLNKKGLFLVYLLWIMDFRYWKKGGHCFNSIQIL